MKPRNLSQGYSVPKATAPVDLRLDANLGTWPPPPLTPPDPSRLASYPKTGPLEAQIAQRFAVDARQVVVTAGGDDAIDRLIRLFIGPGSAVIQPVPGFAVIPLYTENVGGTHVPVVWTEGPYPVDRVLAEVTEETGLIVVCSPNNPTGGVISAEELRRLCEAVPEIPVLVDLAYVEFADTDLTRFAASLPNAVSVRTFSKAYSLAGLRVGYAIGSATLIDWMRRIAPPYAVSAASLCLAEQAIAFDVSPHVAAVKEQRSRLRTHLADLGVPTLPSQGNFVLAQVSDPFWVRDAMAGLGIGIRAFVGASTLNDRVRIGLPGVASDYERLEKTLTTVFAPEALLFDMDGVLADVSTSYRTAIIETAAHFGVRVEGAQIAAVKAAGNANNDWVVTQRLLAIAGVQVPLSEVTAVFEDRYQGGLWQTEDLLVPAEWFDQLSLPWGIVTGRPRQDAIRFLETYGLSPQALVCMEDAPAKPDPAPVRLALQQLGVTHAWLVGDTPDDLRAARAAGVLPIGILAPQDDDPTVLREAGWLLDRLEDLDATR